MNFSYKKVQERDLDVSVIYIAEKETNFKDYSFTTTEFEYVKNQLDEKKKSIDINSYFKWSYIRIIPEYEVEHEGKEKLRKEAFKLYPKLKANSHREILVVDASNRPDMVYAFLEGLGLSHYEFSKYKKNNINAEKSLLDEVQVLSEGISDEDLTRLEVLCTAVYHARDLVNEPLNALNAAQLALAFQQMGKQAGFTVEVFNKKKIESLKLNGLLAVNKGSVDPPSFSIMEWNPGDAVNSKPIVLVGKGVVYDTGGLSLKPTSYMLGMKSDMAGAATVGAAMFAIASLNMPYHVIGLVPATDNRPDGNAYTPGDVITMHNGKTVEVINTDAEGRMILADALSFATQYDPELVFDFATLTGSASVAIGPQGIIAMGNAEKEVFDKLQISGNNTYERVVQLPMWSEYGEMIKSEIADIKNVGGKEAGAITAGKFLQHFVNYPWVHFDIAPYAYLDKPDSYRGSGGTGVGVRLIVDFLNQYKR